MNTTIHPSTLTQDAVSDIQILDVRTPAEFEEIHIPGAKLAPLDSLDPKKIMAAFDPERRVHVVCRSGNRAKQAIAKLEAAGMENAVLVEGGMLAWAETELSVNRGRKTMSLERQVRVAAGFLVVLGAVLAWLVNPAFIGLSAFVGAGLVFAGLTDTCAMGMLIGRMPWNQRKIATVS